MVPHSDRKGNLTYGLEVCILSCDTFNKIAYMVAELEEYKKIHSNQSQITIDRILEEILLEKPIN